MPLARRRAASLALIAALLAGPALAQQGGGTTAFGGIRADTKAPVEVAADALSVNQQDGSATFSGNVVIGQGAMKLSADNVVVVYAKGDQRRIQSLKATGGVTLVSGPDAAEASEASYDVESGTVTLTGDVVVSQGKNVLSGQKMVVDLATGTAQVEGRVRSVLQPGSP